MSAAPEGKRVLLTGPASERAAKRWVDAVYTAPDWTPIHLPLVRIVGRAIDPRHVRDAPGLVAVTSQNALPALKRLWEQREDVKRAPHAAVGVATAQAMRAGGRPDPRRRAGRRRSGPAREGDRGTDRGRRDRPSASGDRAIELRERPSRRDGGRRAGAYRTEDVETPCSPAGWPPRFASLRLASGWGPPTHRASRRSPSGRPPTPAGARAARFTRIVRLAQPTPAPSPTLSML